MTAVCMTQNGVHCIITINTWSSTSQSSIFNWLRASIKTMTIFRKFCSCEKRCSVYGRWLYFLQLCVQCARALKFGVLVVLRNLAILTLAIQNFCNYMYSPLWEINIQLLQVAKKCFQFSVFLASLWGAHAKYYLIKSDCYSPRLNREDY